MKFKNMKFSYIITLLIICITIISGLLFHTVLMVAGDELQNINYALSMQKHIKQNNLSYPLYNSKDNLLFNNVEFQNTNNFYFNRSLDDFKTLVNENYYYEEYTYNCVYYSYLWASYFAYNNINFKFVTTDNHIFTMSYYDDGYCIADGKNLDCYISN